MTHADQGRALRVVIVLATVAGVLNWWASSVAWMSVSADAASLGVDFQLRSSQVAPLQPATALLGAAALIAQLTLGDRVLRVAMLAVAVMSASVAGQIAALANPERRAAVVEAASAVGDAQVNVLPLAAALLGSILLLAVAIIGFTTQGARPRWSSRYERSPEDRRDGATTPAPTSEQDDSQALWRAMDRGEDPT